MLFPSGEINIYLLKHFGDKYLIAKPKYYNYIGECKFYKIEHGKFLEEDDLIRRSNIIEQIDQNNLKPTIKINAMSELEKILQFGKALLNL